MVAAFSMILRKSLNNKYTILKWVYVSVYEDQDYSIVSMMQCSQQKRFPAK